MEHNVLQAILIVCTDVREQREYESISAYLISVNTSEYAVHSNGV